LNVISSSTSQELREGRKGAANAPQVLFSYGREVPKELAGTTARTGDNVGYVTFGSFPTAINF
jgi:actin related protein 2/3 complex, subunit 2